MERDKSFYKGIIFGIIIVLLLNTLYKSFMITYSHFVKHELTYEQKSERIKGLIDKYYVNEYTEEMIDEGKYAGMVLGLSDQYSYYMGTDEFNSFIERTNGAYIGVGVVVGLKDGKALVYEIYDGTPADKSELTEGDVLLKVNGFEINEESYEEGIGILKDNANKEVTLNVYRPSENKNLDIKLVKEDISVPTVSHKMLDSSTGYIKIIQFEGVTTEQFKTALEDLQKQNMKELVIDLRNNPGGLLNVVVEITDMLVPKGYITYVEDKAGDRKYHYSDESCLNIPMAVLVNENSASASEVLAGAVKDLNVGSLVGTRTYGKGVVQSIYKLGDGSGIKLTVAKYYTPSGVCIDGKGIEPNYEIDFPSDFDFNALDDSTDIQLKKAVEVVKGNK